MKALTVRNVPDDIAVALDEENRRRGTSLNQTVLDLLASALGVGGERSNGLARLAGRWSEDDLRRFDEAVAPFSQVDPEMWR